jgi:nucleoside-diphosphate-sugar epimerase
MIIYVTGAGGFIGSCISEYLSEKGHEIIEHKRSIDGDLDPSQIPEKVQLVVNSAGRLGLPSVSRTELAESNTILPEMLADFCSESGIHLIQISTPGVTGLSIDANEDRKYAPWGDYEISKMNGELKLLEHSSLPLHLLTILRPDFVYGPGDMHKLALFRQVSSGWMPIIGRNGSRLRPTFCMDVCRAVESALPGGVLNGGIYNIGGPDIVTVRELSGIISSSLGNRLRTISLPRLLFRLALHLGPLCPEKLSESRFRLFGEDHFVSIDKAADAGFRSEWSIVDGIDQTVRWYQSNGILPR